MVNIKHLFVVSFLLLVCTCTVNALDMPLALDEDGEEIYNNTTNELTDEEVLIVRHSLCNIGVYVCVLEIFGMLSIIYLLLRKKKNDKK